MAYNPAIHHRRSIRLQGYDYSQAGAYFVTICAQNQEHLFGEIVNGEMVLNKAGHVVQSVWNDLPNHYSNIELDAWVIMPNHVHGIIVLQTPSVESAGSVGAGFKPAPTPPQNPPAPSAPLSEIVRALKSFSARRINEILKTQGAKRWHRNYFEHIIRNEADLNHIREYIYSNPSRWELDMLHPHHSNHDQPFADLMLPSTRKPQ